MKLSNVLNESTYYDLQVAKHLAKKDGFDFDRLPKYDRTTEYHQEGYLEKAIQAQREGRFSRGIHESQVNEGAFEDGYAAGKSGRAPNRRASSVYGPGANDYEDGYSKGYRESRSASEKRPTVKDRHYDDFEQWKADIEAAGGTVEQASLGLSKPGWRSVGGKLDGTFRPRIGLMDASGVIFNMPVTESFTEFLKQEYLK